mmetsp:Transcript_45203/g.54819  ORF Transcript_45203/g.54819 Transcript_45203/m.54819 type:complete len:230 (+) Transcript_45203:133-822(+)|eukprot:CAMPEP_0172504138 /NCGR_PEP_ID=MMETSP1066-20121228/175816_1 /TAXON_ID=671091 /ORGANISM="Coscinodiscus wailesii, Strain CCMP2513" /LENGTH=229 /DNA_ID=CAMNT_0013280165 /DNA_START=126 /DNA_END=815 /DNA_ORIENTATION=-
MAFPFSSTSTRRRSKRTAVTPDAKQQRRTLRATPPPPIAPDERQIFIFDGTSPANDKDKNSPYSDNEEKKESVNTTSRHYWKSSVTEDENRRDAVERRKKEGVNVAMAKSEERRMELTQKKRMTPSPSIAGTATGEVPSIQPHEKSIFSVAPQFPEHKRSADTICQDGPSGKRSRMDADDEIAKRGEGEGGGFAGETVYGRWYKVIIPVAVATLAVSTMAVLKYYTRRK